MGSLQFSFRIAFIPTSKSKTSEMSSSNLLRPRCCSCVTDGLREIDNCSSSPFASCDKISRGHSPQVRPIVIVVSPLNALKNDQIRRTSLGTLQAAALIIKRKRNSEDLDSSNGVDRPARLRSRACFRERVCPRGYKYLLTNTLFSFPLFSAGFYSYSMAVMVW